MEYMESRSGGVKMNSMAGSLGYDRQRRDNTFP
jgi:hypothetical protein